MIYSIEDSYDNHMILYNRMKRGNQLLKHMEWSKIIDRDGRVRTTCNYASVRVLKTMCNSLID